MEILTRKQMLKVLRKKMSKSKAKKIINERTRLELKKVYWSKKKHSVKRNVVAVTTPYGQPGLDLWIGKNCLQLSLEESRALAELLNRNFGGVTSTFDLHNEFFRDKLEFMSKWDAIMENVRNVDDFGVHIEDYLQLGKKYRITVTEITDELNKDTEEDHDELLS